MAKKQSWWERILNAFRGRSNTHVHRPPLEHPPGPKEFAAGLSQGSAEAQGS
jgi:hypothetical protein